MDCKSLLAAFDSLGCNKLARTTQYHMPFPDWEDISHEKIVNIAKFHNTCNNYRNTYFKYCSQGVAVPAPPK